MDQCQDAAVLQLPGGRAVVVRAPLDRVLDWFLDASVAAPPARMTREAVQAALSLTNLRFLSSRLLCALLDEGVVSRAAVEALRGECRDAARTFAGGGGAFRRTCGSAAARDVEELFSATLPEGGGGG